MMDSVLLVFNTQVPETMQYAACPINVDMCKHWSDVVAFRVLRHGCFTFADLLDAQLQRRLPREHVPKGMKAAVLDRFGEPNFAKILGLQGNLEALPDKESQDGKLEHERVPPVLRGLSVFAFPRLLRHLVRTGTGMLQVDICNSHPTHMLKMIPEELRSRFQSCTGLSTTDRSASTSS